mmetsp:Transcript_107643/g.309835  ORF Transcript_107643/g.309835 Transcript_107643/m.309835 type:complete len:265 (-) Transcript_107643:455-1249(-)
MGPRLDLRHHGRRLPGHGWGRHRAPLRRHCGPRRRRRHGGAPGSLDVAGPLPALEHRPSCVGHLHPVVRLVRLERQRRDDDEPLGRLLGGAGRCEHHALGRGLRLARLHREPRHHEALRHHRLLQRHHRRLGRDFGGRRDRADVERRGHGRHWRGELLGLLLPAQALKGGRPMRPLRHPRRPRDHGRHLRADLRLELRFRLDQRPRRLGLHPGQRRPLRHGRLDPGPSGELDLDLLRLGLDGALVVGGLRSLADVGPHHVAGGA